MNLRLVLVPKSFEVPKPDKTLKTQMALYVHECWHTHSFTHTHTGMCASAVPHAQYILHCLSCSYSKGEFFQSLLVVLVFHLFINVINNVSCYIPLCDMLKTIQTVIQFISSLQGVVRL